MSVEVHDCRRFGPKASTTEKTTAHGNLLRMFASDHVLKYSTSGRSNDAAGRSCTLLPPLPGMAQDRLCGALPGSDTTYVLLCVDSTAGLQRVSLGPVERYGEMLTGGFIALVGPAFWLGPVL
jgi:hypothetical protein